jgi:hypothetical protein
MATLNAKGKVKRLTFNPTDNTMIAVLSEQGNLTLAKASATGVQNWFLNDAKVT